MAPISQFNGLNRSENNSESSDDSSSETAAQEYQPIVDQTDPRNFAPERPVRASRSMDEIPIAQPISKEGLRTRNKWLTPRREKIMMNYFLEIVAHPGRYGFDRNDWVQELIRRMREPPARGPKPSSPVTLEDLNRWMRSEKFTEILKQLSPTVYCAPAAESTDDVQQNELEPANVEDSAGPKPGSSRSSEKYIDLYHEYISGTSSSQPWRTPPSTMSSFGDEQEEETDGKLLVRPVVVLERLDLSKLPKLMKIYGKNGRGSVIYLDKKTDGLYSLKVGGGKRKAMKPRKAAGAMSGRTLMFSWIRY